MPLEEDLNAASTALVAQLTAIIPGVGPTDSVLIAKGIEALRGSASLQAILTASQQGRNDIAADLSGAIAALLADRNAGIAALDQARIDNETALQAAQSVLLDALNQAVAGQSVRIGDMVTRIVPNVASLPDSFALCDGGLIDAGEAALLRAAWGLDDATPSDFVVNYNATTAGTNPPIAIEGPNIRLPNLLNSTFKNRDGADLGKLQGASIGPDDATFDDADPAVDPATGYLNAPAADQEATPDDTTLGISKPDTTASEPRIRSFGAIPLVRFK